MVKIGSPLVRVFGEPAPVDLRRDNTALLVVDMQYFDAHPDWGEGLTAKRLGVEAAFAGYFARIRAITPAIQALLRSARAAGVEVVHLRVAELTDDSRDVGRKQAVRGLFVPRRSKEAALLEEVAAEGDEIVVSKSSSGVFAWTNLDRLLRTMGIDNLVFCGTSTSGCVESAVKDAADLGYRSLIVADACAAGTVTDHEAALTRLHGGPNRVVEAAEMVAAFDACAAQPVPARRTALARHLAEPLPDLSAGSADDPYRLIFHPPPAPVLNRKETALLVMDIQRFTADPAGGLARLARECGARADFDGYFDRVAAALPRLADLIRACRASGLTVIHTRLRDRTADGRDRGPRHRAYGLALPPDSPETGWLPGFEPADDEIVLDRSGAGAFMTTHLDRLLRNVGARTVILAGTSFDGGLEATARGAGDRDYDVVVAGDAVALLWQAEDVRRLEGGLTTVLPVDRITAAVAPVTVG